MANLSGDCHVWWLNKYHKETDHNFVVYCNGRTIFLKSIDASDVIRDYKNIYEQMEEVSKQVEVANMVQIVTDNGSTFKKIGSGLWKSMTHIGHHVQLTILI